MNLKTFCAILNREFGPPFLKEGKVKAQMKEDGTMILKIGRRDIHVNGRGTILGAGTCLVKEEEEDK